MAWRLKPSRNGDSPPTMMANFANRPRFLVLTSASREPDNHLLWEGLRQYAEVDVHFLNKEQQRNLKKFFASIDTDAYDRIVLDLFFRILRKHARFLKRLPNLVLYEEDACQEYIPSSRWRGKFSAFYRKLPNVRVIITGYSVSEKFRDMGFDVRFLPKGYDSSKLYDTGSKRDIELGFIGRTSSNTYAERKEFIQRATAELDLKAMRTEPGDAYRVALSRIKAFVSVDVGLGEYMAKNFEAMACGCLLLACRQGDGEEQALGFVDGENVILYDDFQGFASKVAFLRNNPEKCRLIAEQGQSLAHCSFDYLKQAEGLYGYLKEDLSATHKSGFERFFEKYR